jgi:hypothetical protein
VSALNLAARLIAAVAHEVAAEYRKLDAPESQDREEMSCTQATTERAPQPTVEVPATAFGFGRPS